MRSLLILFWIACSSLYVGMGVYVGLRMFQNRLINWKGWVFFLGLCLIGFLVWLTILYGVIL